MEKIGKVACYLQPCEASKAEERECTGKWFCWKIRRRCWESRSNQGLLLVATQESGRSDKTGQGCNTSLWDPSEGKDLGRLVERWDPLGHFKQIWKITPFSSGEHHSGGSVRQRSGEGRGVGGSRRGRAALGKGLRSRQPTNSSRRKKRGYVWNIYEGGKVIKMTY